MTTTINLDSGTDVQGSVITDDHFGINATADYQSFEDHFIPSTESLTDAGMELGPIRYPGGTETEWHFDITDPDNTTWVNDNDVEKEFIGLTEFLTLCAGDEEAGIAPVEPVIVIPVNNFIIWDGETPILDDSEEMQVELYNFVQYCMYTVQPSSIAGFEIGNEYWGLDNENTTPKTDGISTSKYTDVVNLVAPTIQLAIDDFVADNNLGPDFEEPEIVMQVWVEPHDNGNAESPEHLDGKSDKQQDELDPEAIEAIDGISVHFYYKEGKWEGSEFEHSYDNMEGAMSYMFDDIADWEAFFADPDGDGVADGNDDLKVYVTEWNIHFREDHDENAPTYSGLTAAAPTLEMFTQYMLHGVDSMQLWPMQFKLTSICDQNGDVNFIGQFLINLQEETRGMQVMDIDYTSSDVDVHGFTDGDTAVIYVSSLTYDTQSVEFGYGGLFPDVDSITTTSIDVAEGSTDGFYRNDSYPWGDVEGEEWDEHQEPDADIFFDENHLVTDDGSTLSFDLDGYEILQIEIDLSDDVEIFGTEDQDTGENAIIGPLYSETIYGGDKGDEIYGGGGNDLIYADSAQAGGPDLSGGDTVHGGHGNDTIYGGDWNDLLYGDEGDDVIYGEDYHDDIYGGKGNDSLHGGVAHDDLYGESGNDALFGDAGQDILDGGDDNDSLTGGDGNDTLTGGDGYDSFVFDAFDGENVITDFEDGIDQVGIIYQQGMTLNGVSYEQIGNDVVLTLTPAVDSTVITFQNTQLSELSVADFYFV